MAFRESNRAHHPLLDRQKVVRSICWTTGVWYVSVEIEYVVVCLYSLFFSS